jgi:FkbM family methyltransferase
MKNLIRLYKKFGLSGIWIFVISRIIKCQVIHVPGIRWPIHLRRETSDLATFFQVFAQEQYNIAIYENIKVIIDAGANIGLASIYFTYKFPEAKIIAVEPDDGNFDVLIKNTREYSNIHCIKAALWHEDGELYLIDKGRGEWGYEVSLEAESSIGKVSAVSIEHIIQTYNINSIDILKMDIEGSEREVFAYNSTEWLDKVDYLIIELHDQYREGASQAVFNNISGKEFSTSISGENLIFEFKK